MSGLDQARQALRDRQGQGARYDAPEAPARELAWARTGTAFFARQLNDLRDADLALPCRVPGWSRAHVVADVAYNARAISRQVEAATAGTTAPMYDSAAARRDAIDLAATLPPHALRHLFAHAAVHLNVVWRDLPGAGWAAGMEDEAGRPRPLSRTAFERARVLWLGALDLDAGGRWRDLPDGLRKALDDHPAARTGAAATLEG